MVDTPEEDADVNPNPPDFDQRRRFRQELVELRDDVPALIEHATSNLLSHPDWDSVVRSALEEIGRLELLAEMIPKGERTTQIQT